MEKIVVFPGSFDPLHGGHLSCARQASLALNADVVFLPCPNGYLGDCQASDEDRLALLKLGLKAEGFPSFTSSKALLHAENPAACLLKLSKSRFKRMSRYMLLGANEVSRFPSLPEAKALSSAFHILIIPQFGVEPNEVTMEELSMKFLSFGKVEPTSSERVRNLIDRNLSTTQRAYIESHRLYYVKKLSDYLHSEHRLLHSISVANLCYEIAALNRFKDPGQAYAAGLLHDCGKHCPKDEEAKIMEEHFPEYKDFPEWSFHQFVGAYLAKEYFGIEDEDILSAIEFHSTGKPHMSPLGKVVYAADKIDPLRGYDSRSLIASCKKQYYLGFLDVLAANQAYLTKQGYVVDNPLTRDCYKLYLGE